MSLAIKGKSAHVRNRQTCYNRKSVDEIPPLNKEEKSLEDKFTISLKQQVKLLQIENNFLRQQNESEKEKSQCQQIYSRGNEVSLNGETWCQLPPFHPPLHQIIPERVIQQNQYSSLHQLEEQRRQKDHERISRDRRDHSMPSRTSSIREKQSSFIMSESDILVDLEQAERRNSELEKQIRHLKIREEDQTKVINSLSMSIQDLESKGNQELELANSEKRALMEELLELQKRIDEMTPAVAEKEVKIIQLENEKSELNRKIRSSNNDVSNLQIEISQLKNEATNKNYDLNKMKEENKKLEGKVEELKLCLNDYQKKENELMEEINSYSVRLRELELIRLNDKKIIEQSVNENSSLMKENATLSTKIVRFEQQIELLELKEAENKQFDKSEEVEQARNDLRLERKNVDSLRNQIEMLQSRISELENVIAEHDKNDEAQMADRGRFEKELNALHALSKSLSAENKLLREDKLSNDEVIEELKGKIKYFESNLKTAEDLHHEREKQLSNQILELEEEAKRKHQKYLEFEELSKTLHQITSLLPSKTSSMTYDCGKSN